MNATLVSPRVVTTLVAAALSFVIATGLLAAVVELFHRDGLPLQNVAMAERACSEHAFVSERTACVEALLAASYHRHVATR